TKFWLEARHNNMLRESVPVPVPYALSDIDFVGLRPDGGTWSLPNGVRVGPRIIVETKDEHNWDATGREFGALLAKDATMLDSRGIIPKAAKGVKFTMLREEHF